MTDTVSILRIYPCGGPTKEPAPFSFALVVVYKGFKATLKALCSGVTAKAYKAIAQHLLTKGIAEVEWNHNGTKKTLRLKL